MNHDFTCDCEACDIERRKAVQQFCSRWFESALRVGPKDAALHMMGRIEEPGRLEEPRDTVRPPVRRAS